MKHSGSWGVPQHPNGAQGPAVTRFSGAFFALGRRKRTQSPSGSNLAPVLVFFAGALADTFRSHGCSSYGCCGTIQWFPVPTWSAERTMALILNLISHGGTRTGRRINLYYYMAFFCIRVDIAQGRSRHIAFPDQEGVSQNLGPQPGWYSDTSSPSINHPQQVTPNQI